MKKIVLFCFASLLIIITNPSYSAGVLCNSGNSMCSAGSSNAYGHNVYVNNGIMCSSEMGMCSNGFAVLRTGGVIKKSKKNLEENKVPLINEAEEIQKLAELYDKGLITQIEFNRKKSNINVYENSEADKLKNFAALYERGLITTTEYNREKARILK